MRTIFLALSALCCNGCGGTCEVSTGTFDCTMTIQQLAGTYCASSVHVGSALTYPYVVDGSQNRTCETDVVNVGPQYEGGSAIWVWYNGTLSGLTSTRLEGTVTYRVSPNQSGSPDCRATGPLVCVHR
jgi:hypothetical protein